ncbi:MAG TPA: polysaccharide biosynthesis tyrosine autokinase [Pseudolabrys sp.]|nr:polysaccharide biosynthesis tyrosine autokinase [Pseudolabrys sp.]
MLQHVSVSNARNDRRDSLPPPPDVMANYTQHLRESLRVLKRRRGIIALTTLAFVTAAVLFVMLTAPRYTATSTVLIDPRRSSVADNDGNQHKASSPTSDEATVNSQAVLLQSPAVLRRVVDQLNLGEDEEFGGRTSLLAPVMRLFTPARPAQAEQDTRELAATKAVNYLGASRLKVARDGSTFVINIDATSEDPQKAARIANAVTDAYFAEQVQSKFDTRKIAATWFDQQLQALKSKVQESDRAVEEYRAKNNLTIAQGVTVNDQQMTDLNNKLVEAHVQTAEARARFEQVESIASNKGDPGTIAQALSSEVITRLRTQYAEVSKTLADVSSKFGPQHPLVVNARAQLRETKKLIDEEVHRILESTRQAYTVAKSREDALSKSLTTMKATSNESGLEQVRLRELQREADATRTLYETFLARYKETSAQETLELPDARLVAKATAPVQPSFPKGTLILAVAGMLGIGFGSVLAFLLDSADHRVKSLRHAEEVTGVPTLAAIPVIGTRELSNRANRGRAALESYDPNAIQLLPTAMQPPLMRYVLDEPTSLFAESVRAVRLAIQRATRHGPAKSIVVTSSIDGEGKTTLATNLALSIAALGQRTILVEGDLRNPEMSRSLCPQAKIGVVEVALGQAPIEQALFVDRATGLAVLPSPPRPRGASNEFVFSDAMRNMLDRLRTHFDCVIIDSPPLVPLVDARALGEIADRVLLTIRWDATPRDVVAQALETLAPMQERLLGTVLTRVDMQRLRDYDYYRSSSYITPYSYLGQPRAGVTETT